MGRLIGYCLLFFAIVGILVVSLVSCGVTINPPPANSSGATSGSTSSNDAINANATIISQNATIQAQRDAIAMSAAQPQVQVATQRPVMPIAPQAMPQAPMIPPVSPTRVSAPVPVPMQSGSDTNPACAKMTKLTDLDGSRRMFDSGWVIVNVYKISGETEHKILISPTDPHIIQGWKGSAWWIGTDCGAEAMKQFIEVNPLGAWPVSRL